MRFGIIGVLADSHVRKLSDHCLRRGIEPVIIDTSAQALSNAFSLRDGQAFFNNSVLSDVPVFFLRAMLAPLPYVQCQGKELRLYPEWHEQHRQARDKHGFLLAWLLALESLGHRVMNPVEHGQIGQLKPFHTWSLRKSGLPMPETLITSDPAEARDFVRQIGECVTKPVMGGGSAKLFDPASLDDIASCPVIIQRCIRGDNIRVTLTCERILSAVRIPSDALDYREGTNYEDGKVEYEPLQLPESIEKKCQEALRISGYYYSGMDLIRDQSGDWYFLEANSSPAFADIENKTHHPISRGLVDCMLALAEGKIGLRRP